MLCVLLKTAGEPEQRQVKLLTVLQDRKFYRIGGIKEISMEARIIAATNRDLLQKITAGRFQQDLYYRLNVIPVYIPPLRERKEDIVPLAEHIFVFAKPMLMVLIDNGKVMDSTIDYLMAVTSPSSGGSIRSMMFPRKTETMRRFGICVL